MSWDIWAIVVYTLNDFKRAYSKIYSDLSALIRKNLCAADFIIKDIRLIKDFQAKTFFDDDFIESFSIIVSRVNIIKTDTSILSTRVIVFKFSILKIVSVISRKTLQVERIDQLNESNIVSSVVSSVSFQVRFFNLDKKVFVFFINQDSRFTEYKFSSVINDNVLNETFQKDIARRILRRILLSSTMKLFKIVRFKTNERFLNAFNNATAFIFDIDDYIVSICVCVEVLNILRYKINNIRSTLNELILIITELRNVHEEDKKRFIWNIEKKMIFLTNAILKNLSLLSFNKIIINQKIWTFFTMIQKNNRIFHEKIIKNYINMIIEILVNTFDKFVKKIK